MDHRTKFNESFITVCIPAYNRPDYLINLINSIHDFADFPVEIIVHDDHSNNITVNKLLEIKNRISSLILNNGRYQIGLVNSLQRCIEVAGSDFIVFLNADCLITKSFFKDIVNILKKPYVGFIGLLQHGFPKEVIKTNGTEFSFKNGVGSGAVFAFRKSTCFDVGGLDLDVRNGCLPVFQNIEVISGRKNITDIDVNDYVISGDGNIKKVLKTFKSPYKGKLIRLKTKKIREYVYLTEDHTVDVFRLHDRKNIPYRNSCMRKILKENNYNKCCLDKYGKFLTINAKDIILGDYLFNPIRLNGFSNIDFIDLFDINNKMGNEVNTKIKLTDEVLELFGYYIAEGSIRYDGIQFTLSISEIEFKDRIVYLMEKIFGIKCYVNKRLKYNGITINAYNVNLGKFFSDYFGENSYNIHIPNDLCNLHPNKLRVIVDAIYRGEGHRCKNDNRKSITTTSQQLSYQLLTILTNLSLYPSYYIEKSKFQRWRKYSECYKILWVDIDKNIPHNISFFDSDKKKFWMLEVSEIDRINYNDFVHNIEVEDDHNYQAGHINVHNCCDMPIQYKMFSKGYFHAILKSDSSLVRNMSQEQKGNSDSTIGKTVYDSAIPQLFNCNDYEKRCSERWDYMEQRFRDLENKRENVGNTITDIGYWSSIMKDVMPVDGQISSINWDYYKPFSKWEKQVTNDLKENC